jgi:phosphopantothenate synthetase
MNLNKNSELNRIVNGSKIINIFFRIKRRKKEIYIELTKNLSTIIFDF